MQGKGGGPVNRVELESQVLCAALRQSLHVKDKVGAFTSVRELSHLFPDLLPPPEEDDAPGEGNKANFYTVIGAKPQSAANGVIAAYLKTVRNFLRTHKVAEDRLAFNRILNAGFVLRKPRLRLSHDLVVSRRWLHEESRKSLKLAESQEITMEHLPALPASLVGTSLGIGHAATAPHVVPPAAAKTPPPVVPPVSPGVTVPPVPPLPQFKSEPTPQLAPAASLAPPPPLPTLNPPAPPLPVATMSPATPIPSLGPESRPHKGVTVPPVPPLPNIPEYAGQQAAAPPPPHLPPAAEQPNDFPSPFAAFGASSATPPPAPQQDFGVSQQVPVAPTPTYESASEYDVPAPTYDPASAASYDASAPTCEPPAAPAPAYEPAPAFKPEQPPVAPVDMGVLPAHVRAQLNEPAAPASASAPRAPGRISKEAAFVFDESALRKPQQTNQPTPVILQLMEAAQIISAVEAQAIMAQIAFAPNIPVEKHILNAGYVNATELASVKLGESLLQSGKISMAQFQVAIYDERTSGLRMAESLQVRGWLSVEVRNAIDDFQRRRS